MTIDDFVVNEYAARPNIPGYMSVKQASKMLGLSPSRVYEYVEEERLSSMWAADVIMIPLHEIQKFKRKSSGRPRKSVPIWRISSGDNTQFVTSITAQVREDQQHAFMQKLATIRQGGKHTFPGTVARFIVESETTPNQVEISLVWRSSSMPCATEREKTFETLRHELAEVLDWSTVRYNSGKVLMHTS